MPSYGPSGFIRTQIEMPQEGADLTAVTAATVMASKVVGYRAEVEEFGFQVTKAFTGAGGTQTWTLTDGSDNVIATLVTTLAAATKGATLRTTTIVTTFRDLVDGATLKIKRTATGTAYTAGDGYFYVVLRQRMQARA